MLAVDFDYHFHTTPKKKGGAASPETLAAIVDEELERFYDTVCVSWSRFKSPHRRNYLLRSNAYLRAESIYRMWKLKYTESDAAPLAKHLVDHLLRCVASPGESIGIQTAQSIAHEATQSTLNTFHTSGANSAQSVLGSGAVKSILEAQKRVDMPSIRVPFKPEYATREHTRRLQNFLSMHSLEEFISKIDIIYVAEDGAVDLDLELLHDSALLAMPEFEEIDSPILIRMTLDRELLFGARMSMAEIAAAIRRRMRDLSDHYSVIASDTNTSHDLDLVVRIRCTSIKAKTKDKYTFITRELRNLRLRGIEYIQDAIAAQEGDMQLFGRGSASSQAYGLACVNYEGNMNLFRSIAEIAKVEGVDLTSLSVDHIRTTCDLYGIEVARMDIVHQLMRSFNDSQLYATVQLVADAMTSSGRIIPSNKEGIRNKSSVLSKVAFETPFSNLRNAALANGVDNMRSNSSRVMFNQ
mmetsp:Transcript_3523/g.8440  ORF Transcript_3523/g.8440 Transcript_3523/m.8440 type:complete len:468 (+) Transcript_3523:44-1447(+)